MKLIKYLCILIVILGFSNISYCVNVWGDLTEIEGGLNWEGDITIIPVPGHLDPVEGYERWECFVPAGELLEITTDGAPIEIEVTEECQLVIEGSIAATGTADDMITFTWDEADEWRGILFTGDGDVDEPSSFTYCDIGNTITNGIAIDLDIENEFAIDIDYCHFHHTTNGIDIRSEVQVIVTHSEFNNLANGIYSSLIDGDLTHQFPQVASCYFHNCTDGVDLADAPSSVSAQIFNCIFDDLGGSGVRMVLVDEDSDVFVDHCTFTDCGTVNMWGRAGGGVFIQLLFTMATGLYHPGDATINNCIFVDNTAFGLDNPIQTIPQNQHPPEQSIFPIEALNNTFHNDNNFSQYTRIPFTEENDNEIGPDPYLAGANDFHMLWHSHCLNSGVGDDDPDGSDPDRGAYGGPGIEDDDHPFYPFQLGAGNFLDEWEFNGDNEDFIYITDIPDDLEGIHTLSEGLYVATAASVGNDDITIGDDFTLMFPADAGNNIDLVFDGIDGTFDFIVDGYIGISNLEGMTVRNLSGFGSVEFNTDVSITNDLTMLQTAGETDNEVIKVGGGSTLTVGNDVSFGIRGKYTIDLDGGASFELAGDNNITVEGLGAGDRGFEILGESSNLGSITSSEGAPNAGDWGSIIVGLNNSYVDAKIDYCTIEYGGGNAGTAMLAITGTGESDLDLTHCEIKDSDDDAISFLGGDVEIANCSILDADNGIILDESSLFDVHNNFLYEFNDDAGSGHGIICNDDDELDNNVRIYNNIIFNTNGDGIRLASTSDANILYNTIHNPEGNCITVEGGGSGDEIIFNNVFSSWPTGGDDFAVEYTNNNSTAGVVDYNIYCDLLGNYWDDTGFAGEGDYTERVTFGNGGPQQVAHTRNDDTYFEYDPRYNPWTGGGGEKDDIACALFDTDAIPFDFHVYEGYLDDPTYHLGGIPVFANRGYIGVEEEDWWYGEDVDYPFDPKIDPNERPDLFQNSAPDAGAYGGPWSNAWTDTPVDDNIIDDGWHDPYIIVDTPDYFWTEFIVYLREYVILAGDLNIDDGDEFEAVPGLLISVPSTVSIDLDGGEFSSVGTSTYPITWACLEAGETSPGISVNSGMDAGDVEIEYNNFLWQDFGIYASGVTSTGSDRVLIANTTFEDCGTSVYINNSRVELKDCEISGSDDQATFGVGVYITGSSAGKVLIDGCDIHDNGSGSTALSAGVYCTNSDPEIINTEIYDNSGGGIYCTGASPDLDTYSSTGNQSNEISSNGGATQSGSDGAEIFLTSFSSPTMKHNNIVDFDGTLLVQNGYCIYNDDYNYANVSAYSNWWGTNSPDLYSMFYEPVGFYVYYNPWASSAYTIADNSPYEVAMGYWAEGEYTDAAEIFEELVYTSGYEAINSIRYLTGCVSETNGNFSNLRTLFQDVTDENDDEQVVKVAARYSTHCYTEMGEYEDARDEYQDRAENAETLRDSLLAMVDYWTVYELIDGNIDALSQKDSHKEVGNLLSLLHNGKEADRATLLPKSFMVVEAYPNPFNSTTTIIYNLSEDIHVNMTIHDMSGRRVEVLVNEIQNAGYRSAIFQANNLPSGLYFCRMEAGGVTNIQKLTLLK